jgi:hypothetical protein
MLSLWHFTAILNNKTDKDTHILLRSKFDIKIACIELQKPLRTELLKHEVQWHSLVSQTATTLTNIPVLLTDALTNILNACKFRI